MNHIETADIINIINEFNVSKIFDNKIMDSINKSFGLDLEQVFHLAKVLFKI